MCIHINKILYNFVELYLYIHTFEKLDIFIYIYNRYI